MPLMYQIGYIGIYLIAKNNDYRISYEGRTLNKIEGPLNLGHEKTTKTENITVHSKTEA